MDCSIVCGSFHIVQELIVPATCGANNGEVDLICTFDNGLTVADYIIVWTPSGSGLHPTGLAAGAYTVTILCALDPSTICFTKTYVITALAPVLTLISAAHICKGTCTGSLIVTVSGGSDPYDLAWTGPEGYTGTGTSISGLCPGTYNLTVTDAAGCTVNGSYDIIEMIPIQLTLTVTPATNCKCDGTAIVNIFPNFNGPYLFVWSDGVIDNSLSIRGYSVASGLCAGNHSVTISGANGCPQTTLVVIDGQEPFVPLLGPAPIDDTCEDCTRCKMNITDYEARLQLALTAVLGITNQQLNLAIAAMYAGDPCSEEFFNNVNDFNYLLAYLSIIYNQRQMDIAASPDGVPRSSDVYRALFNLDCVNIYFKCKGYDLTKVWDAFDLVAGSPAPIVPGVDFSSVDPAFYQILIDHCDGDGAAVLSPPLPGGVWAGTGIIEYAGDTYFDPSASGIGVFPITYTVSNFVFSVTIEVHANPVVTCDDITVPDDTPSFALSGGMPSGGTYFDNFGLITNGVFDVATAGIGTHQYFYQYFNQFGCSNFVTANVIVVAGDFAPDLNEKLIQTELSVNVLADPQLGDTTHQGLAYLAPLMAYLIPLHIQSYYLTILPNNDTDADLMITCATATDSRVDVYADVRWSHANWDWLLNKFIFAGNAPKFIIGSQETENETFSPVYHIQLNSMAAYIGGTARVVGDDGLSYRPNGVTQARIADCAFAVGVTDFRQYIFIAGGPSDAAIIGKVLPAFGTDMDFNHTQAVTYIDILFDSYLQTFISQSVANAMEAVLQYHMEASGITHYVTPYALGAWLFGKVAIKILTNTNRFSLLAWMSLGSMFQGINPKAEYYYMLMCSPVFRCKYFKPYDFGIAGVEGGIARNDDGTCMALIVNDSGSDQTYAAAGIAGLISTFDLNILWGNNWGDVPVSLVLANQANIVIKNHCMMTASFTIS